jgi:phosphoadenosine phosphosulfate reductase
MIEKEIEAVSSLYSLKDSYKNMAVSFSGGKDSLVALDLAIRVGIQNVVFVDTTIEFEETKEYVNAISDFYGISVDVVRAPSDFFSLAEKVGFPSRRFRWCCEVFKFAPLMTYARKNEVDAYITGLRSDESARRKRYRLVDVNPVMPIAQINPLLEWSKNDIWQYIEKYKLPVNELYSHFDRIGCWCCPYRSESDWGFIEEKYPQKMNVLEDNLLKYADRVGISDSYGFIKKRGWSAFAPPINRIIIGLCQISNDGNGKLNVKLTSEIGSQDFQKIANLLPIITTDYEINEGQMVVKIERQNRSRLRVLVEKSINCANCGACIAICPTGALYLDNETIHVDEEKCNHCYRCLNTKILRGGCIMRNYSPKRASFIAKVTN